eukprot:4473680-Amphidinium_carterae.1
MRIKPHWGVTFQTFIGEWLLTRESSKGGPLPSRSTWHLSLSLRHQPSAHVYLCKRGSGLGVDVSHEAMLLSLRGAWCALRRRIFICIISSGCVLKDNPS